MRFRKTITLFKGLKLNISKSGVTVTVGRRGLSANVGRKGVYVNTGIPGTGLYDRKKVFDFGGGKKASGRAAVKESPVVEEAALEAEALTEAFVNIAEQACDLPGHPSDRELALPPDPEAVEAEVARWLEGLQMPIDFNVSYEYEDGVLFADMDLPEIEHLPTREAVRLASGQIKARDKSQKTLKAEYARCVFGLAMFCASHFFAVTPHMEQVLLSAYTQRRDARGDIEDVYLYSVIFTRESFEQKNYQQTEPEAFLCRFRNRMNKASDGTLRRIEPFGAQDL